MGQILPSREEFMLEINFPLLPKRVYGVINLFLLTVFSFYYYYIGIGISGYEQVENCYLENIVSKKKGKIENVENVKISLQIPKVITHTIDRPVIVTLNNFDNEDLKDVKIWLELKSDNSDNSVILLTDAMVNFDVLEQHSSSTRIMYLRIQPEQKDEGDMIPVFYISHSEMDSQMMDLDFVLPEIQYEPNQAVLHSIGDILLLPPWSNGVLVLIVLVLSGIVEMLMELFISRNKETGHIESWSSPFKILKRHLYLSVWITHLFFTLVLLGFSFALIILII